MLGRGDTSVITNAGGFSFSDFGVLVPDRWGDAVEVGVAADRGVDGVFSTIVILVSSSVTFAGMPSLTSVADRFVVFCDLGWGGGCS